MSRTQKIDIKLRLDDTGAVFVDEPNHLQFTNQGTQEISLKDFLNLIVTHKE